MCPALAPFGRRKRPQDHEPRGMRQRAQAQGKQLVNAPAQTGIAASALDIFIVYNR